MIGASKRLTVFIQHFPTAHWNNSVTRVLLSRFRRVKSASDSAHFTGLIQAQTLRAVDEPGFKEVRREQPLQCNISVTKIN